jgi:predicted alpha-1,2-mannosidase
LDYREANAWQYTFSVPHDVPGMIELYGGREAFVARLDELFNQDSDMDFPLVDITGVIGQYAHGNEPCHHVPYLYALAGAQYKTALRTRQLMAMQYDNTPEGLCGNDDCGQISAWYVFSAIGLYPLNAADGRYVIGSPIVEKAVLKLDPTFYPGGMFTILAPGVSKQHMYVKSARLNGRELDRPWVTHEEIAKGGTLEFEMSILPEKKIWAFPGAELSR